MTHVWGDTFYCLRCGASAEEVKDGAVPPECPAPENVRHIRDAAARRRLGELLKPAVERLVRRVRR